MKSYSRFRCFCVSCHWSCRKLEKRSCFRFELNRLSVGSLFFFSFFVSEKPVWRKCDFRTGASAIVLLQNSQKYNSTMELFPLLNYHILNTILWFHSVYVSNTSNHPIVYFKSGGMTTKFVSLLRLKMHMKTW
jgi:hypothetical protein